MNRDEIFQKLRAVGRAALTIALENSHSGNLAVKWTDESGAEVLAITATGSQKGELSPDRICFPTLTHTNSGYFKASTETDIHARILQIPGVRASMHCHTKTATVITLDDEPLPKANPRPPLIPLDQLGVRHLGPVPVDWFKVQSGSPEMTETIPQRLKTAPACIIQEHGAFARGASLEEAFFYLGLIEHSGQVIFFSEILKADLEAARKKAEELKPRFRQTLPAYSSEQDSRRDFADEPDTIEMFLKTGYRIFESGYSPFHTGSMSIRGADTLLYLPKASLPHDLPGPMLELPLSPGGKPDLEAAWQSAELDLHRAIYRETPFKALVHGYLAEAQAQALARSDELGSKTARIRPIDAEGGFLYPAVPILPPEPNLEDLCRALMDYRVAIVAFGGVWSAGEQSVSEALRHLSSVKDICFYRIMAKLRGLDLSVMEPTRGKNW